MALRGNDFGAAGSRPERRQVVQHAPLGRYIVGRDDVDGRAGIGSAIDCPAGINRLALDRIHDAETAGCKAFAQRSGECGIFHGVSDHNQHRRAAWGL